MLFKADEVLNKFDAPLISLQFSLPHGIFAVINMVFLIFVNLFDLTLVLSRFLFNSLLERPPCVIELA
jgi:hypothetical protein